MPNDYKELPLEFWEKPRPHAMSAEEAMSFLYRYAEMREDVQDTVTNKMKLAGALNALSIVVAKMSSFKEAYNFYVDESSIASTFPEAIERTAALKLIQEWIFGIYDHE